jgi:hypothetical protein
MYVLGDFKTLKARKRVGEGGWAKPKLELSNPQI